MNHYNKYLKYKNKYLKLKKNQKGGVPPEPSNSSFSIFNDNVIDIIIGVFFLLKNGNDQFIDINKFNTFIEGIKTKMSSDITFRNIFNTIHTIQMQDQTINITLKTMLLEIKEKLRIHSNQITNNIVNNLTFIDTCITSNNQVCIDEI